MEAKSIRTSYSCRAGMLLMVLLVLACLCLPRLAWADESSTADASISSSDAQAQTASTQTATQAQTIATSDDEAQQEQQEDEQAKDGQQEDEQAKDESGSEISDATTTSDDSSNTKDKAEDESSDKDEEAVVPVNVVVSVRFVGLDSEWARIADIELEEGSTAWDASELALARSGMPCETGSGIADDVLVSLARSELQDALAADVVSGSAWHLYINGERYQGSASTYVLADGDELAWCYELGSIEVSVSVVGPGGTGLDYWIPPTSVTVAATQSAWDASHIVFEQNGYGDGRLLSYSVAEDGAVELEAVASLGSNGVTGESWQVFVNGMRCAENIAMVELHAGDSICWYYAGNGTMGLPSFAEKTGAASQSPQVTVNLVGEVAQTWSEGADDSVCLSDMLDTVTGVSVSGQGDMRSLVVTSEPLSVAVSPVTGSKATPEGNVTRRTSLSCLLDGKLTTGQGGRAAFGADGALYYLDDVGSMVKLELQ